MLKQSNLKVYVKLTEKNIFFYNQTIITTIIYFCLLTGLLSAGSEKFLLKILLLLFRTDEIPCGSF